MQYSFYYSFTALCRDAKLIFFVQLPHWSKLGSLAVLPNRIRPLLARAGAALAKLV